MLNNGDLKNIDPKDEDKDGIPDFAEEKMDSVPDESKEYQESLTDGKTDKGFLKKAIEKGRKVIAGENTVGKIGAKTKDLLTRFGILPKWINEATDEIGNSLKQKPKTMKEPKFKKIKRYLKQKSTQSAIALIATVVSAIFAGVEINPEVLTESLLGIITGLAAAWAGVMAIVEMFRDEDA